MKTLAVIKNELFQDYLRFVSTSDLPSVLDNPDIPVPFTCVESVENFNSDAIMDQLKNYFQNSKVVNKDFYVFDEDTSKQLEFMFNLIKLSSGQTTPVASSQSSAPSVSTSIVSEPIIKEIVVKESNEVLSPTQIPVEVIQNIVEETTSSIEPVYIEEDVDPFGFQTKPVQETVTHIEETPVVVPEDSTPVELKQEIEMIESLGIAKGSTIHFIKDESIIATLIDDKTVSYENQHITLVEAAKAAFKKSSTVGMAVGLSNWLYEGETLKAWKEKKLN